MADLMFKLSLFAEPVLVSSCLHCLLKSHGLFYLHFYYIHFDVVILLVLNKPTTLKSAFFFLNLKVGHMFIEEDVDIMGTLKEIKIACNVKKNSLVVQPNASYINGGINHLIQFQCLANRKIMCPIKKISLLSEKKKKRMAM